MEGLYAFIDGLPKAELHMHLEGSLEPEMVMELARRNSVDVPWASADELRSAYSYTDLDSFLAVFWGGCRVLRHEQDFYEMAMAYFKRARQQNVLHAEVFIGLQSFIPLGVEMASILDGITRARIDAEKEVGITSRLMVNIHRHRPESAAFDLLSQVAPWWDQIAAFGLAGPEMGNPPSRFARFFGACRESGFRVVAHAGEEGPSSYVRETVSLLNADRVDHGNACIDDMELVQEIALKQIPLTLCPFSNLKLNVVNSLRDHPLKRLMNHGVKVTINSDDPSLFGGYINENFKACCDELELSKDQVVEIARNSFTASFLSEAEKHRYLGILDGYVAGGTAV
ncbi:adenosine deaminase [Aminobacter ciceronei]|uniref:Adenine deaminase n=1 Tax=Aminobacter ciceronei TaxID=150723 RepID=A0ABR6CH67_9HYPH|nr:adenosine deaminase [Aminobacter ciceronei]MBA8909940.1 adenosine deaminase [Aminobacter ciceronei]MBA9023712.1 adenosine deaminase [Aminobacter ciceronei]